MPLGMSATSWATVRYWVRRASGARAGIAQDLPQQRCAAPSPHIRLGYPRKRLVGREESSVKAVTHHQREIVPPQLGCEVDDRTQWGRAWDSLDGRYVRLGYVVVVDDYVVTADDDAFGRTAIGIDEVLVVSVVLGHELSLWNCGAALGTYPQALDPWEGRRVDALESPRGVARMAACGAFADLVVPRRGGERRGTTLRQGVSAPISGRAHP